MRLERHISREGLALLGDLGRPGGVSFAFTERAGGVSVAPFASLNLGDACGDDPAAVAENRHRALVALGAGDCERLLVNPRQVHGDEVVVVRSSDPTEVEKNVLSARAGADAVVCTAKGVPVLLCFADCVPVVIVVDGGFAVVHSGWKGTIARIAAKALRILCAETGASPADAKAYIGPHIAGADYEVSQDLLDRFVNEFGPRVSVGESEGERRLDLSAAIVAALGDEGMGASQILDCGISTPRTTDRFYSYRAESGRCGRHGAMAVML